MALPFHPHDAFTGRQIIAFGIFFALATGLFVPWARAAGSGCTAKECHAGIMDIVPQDLPMMALIQQNGLRHGDMDGCVICHGGNPGARDKDKAHQGIPSTLKQAPGPKAFYPSPGAIRVAQNTCGVCHPGYVYRVSRSLMNTEAGKIQGNLSTWGLGQGYEVVFGNQDLEDPDGPVPSGAALDYEAYMARMKQAFPGQFPSRLSQLPLPEVEEIEKDPARAAFIYQRRECQRCHLGVKGRQGPGEFRAEGCAACHLGYDTQGMYQGKDRSIPKDEAGHIRLHRIQGNRKTGGVPVATCQACHNRGKRIGVSFAGLMESPFSGPFDPEGRPQPPRYGKTYTPVLEDVHHRTQSRQGNPQGGLLCQDCHTSMDIHGDGNIQGTTLAQVEIECTDCHGTPDRFPWELPLGHGDEFGFAPPDPKGRGVAQTRLLASQQFGFDHDPADGYILSARGNPLGNAVRQGDRVLVHSATGKDFFVPVLKGLEKPSPLGNAAMIAVSGHLEKMECYACHGAWTPQCYGCHIKIDFSDPDKKGTDWVKLSHAAPAAGEGPGQPSLAPGEIEEQTGYLRWEDPVLGINGEGRVSPLMPGCQVAFTVIGRDGRTLAHSRMPENLLEATAAGQEKAPLALDMAPVQPHTTSQKARSCESCHALPKTLGLGIGDGRFRPMASLDFDWSQVVTREGLQLATVGTHWPASRAFKKEELDRILRTGTCMGCHKFGKADRVWQRFSRKGQADPVSHDQLMERLIRGTP